MNLYECPEHVDLSTPCLIILVTINAMDIVWYYGVGGAPMEELILNAQYMWTSPTPCLIILVTINPMNIMVPKVSWWMNVQYVWTHPPLD